ncbi:hypothetical protein [Sphingomonas panacisoli]|uniref:hypothetical protein n=1 Tax=Sphingomonas panacisoli TaxID=1813879 RepID=UPI001644C4E8|nr:hypothetical protein [Sphingomonas panacisoli]
MPDGTGLSSATPIEPVPVSPVPASIPSAILVGLCDFPPDAALVLEALGDGEFVQSARYISGDIGVPEARVKEVHRALRTLGFAEIGTLMTEEGQTCGSGYWITGRGERFREALAQAIEARRAETQGGSVHESAVPQGCAQKGRL